VRVFYTDASMVCVNLGTGRAGEDINHGIIRNGQNALLGELPSLALLPVLLSRIEARSGTPKVRLSVEYKIWP